MSLNAEDVKTALIGRFADFYSQFTPLKPLGGELRGPCPLHGGTGHNFAVNPDTGLWNCFSRCQDGGDAFRFLEKMEGISFPEALEKVAAFAGVSSEAFYAAAPVRRAQPVPTPAPVFLDISLAEQLHGNLMNSDKVRRWLSDVRGLSTETLTRFQIGLLPPAAKGEEWRITFPVFDAEGRLLNLRKHLFSYKPDLTEERRRELGKTKPWATGLSASLFPLAAIEGAASILIVEGEADAALACQMGFAAITGTSGAGTWKPEWTDALRGCQCVTILYDGDQPGQDGAHKAAAALAAVIPDVRIASLPDGEDFTSWVVDKGATAADVQQAIAQAVPFVPETAKAPISTDAAPSAKTPETKHKPPLRKPIADRIVDLADVQPPTDLPLLFGQYLLKGAAHWLTGQTGLGKSTLLFNIACALAEGNPLWDMECEQTRVLYVDAESGDVGRAHKIERLYRDSPRVRGWLLFLREPVKLPEELPEMLTFVQEQEISLVIFDTARRCFSVKDENDNAEVYQRIVPTLDALKLAGVASLTMGHPSKANNGSARGAGAQEDAGDVNLSLTMHRGEVSDPDGVIALRVTKNRLLGLGIPPLFLKRIGDDQFEHTEAADSGPAEEPVSKQLQCHQFLRKTLEASDTPLSHGVLWSQAEKAGHKRATFDRAWKEVKAEDDVTATDDGYSLDPFAN